MTSAGMQWEKSFNELAGGWRRLGAFVVDALVVAVAIRLGMPFAANVGIAVAIWPYRTAMHALLGQTIGKLVMGISVRSDDHRSRPSIGATAVREALYFAVVVPMLIPAIVIFAFDLKGHALAVALVPMLLLMWMIPSGLVTALAMIHSSSDRKTWADRIAQTVVVRNR